MHAYEDGLVWGPCAFEDGDVFESVAFLTEGYDAKVSPLCGEIGFDAFLYE